MSVTVIYRLCPVCEEHVAIKPNEYEPSLGNFLCQICGSTGTVTLPFIEPDKAAANE